MNTLLLELFSEEIPSRMQRGAMEQLQRLMLAGFEKNMLKPSDVKTFVSPRHLAIQCFGLPTIQPDVKEEKRGPKIGAPEQALKGFLGSTGLTLNQCEQRDGYYYATIERKGRAVAEVVKEIVESALTSFVWPKSMHWGSRAERPIAWVRPLHRIACLLDEKVVPVQFGHLTASNITQGHRFLAPAAITIPHAEQYETLLEKAHVMVDFAKRRERIAQEVTALAQTQNLKIAEDAALLDEVTGLVEWPVPLLCQFDKKFLGLPPEVLISEMKNHQRYFPLMDASGKLSDRFITVANMVNADGGARVKDGNARVVRARLADGEFYWEQDRKVKLEDWGKKLSDVVFHAKVGMMDAKVQRIEKLAVEISKAVGYADEKSVRRAAQLCKADLTSGMVGEFPELQGIMGRYYATAQKESPEIADAIRDHYKPLGANDSVPESKLAAIIAIADKLDSIVSLFAAGEKPTGSKDPLALRRAGNGIMRILYTHKFTSSTLVYDLDLIPLVSSEKNAAEIIDFLKERLRNELSLTLGAEITEAVLSVQRNTFSPNILKMYAHVVNDMARDKTGQITIMAIRRAVNILAAEEKKSKETFTFSYNVEPDRVTSEDRLHSLVVFGLQEMESMCLSPDIMIKDILNDLAEPINKFFAEVMVNADDPTVRRERLRLLAGIRELSHYLADFTKIPDLTSEAIHG